MKPSSLSFYSSFIRVSIRLGIAFFFLMAVFCFGSAVAASSTTAGVAALVALSSGFAGIGWFGLRLLPFLDFSCAATTEGLYLFDRQRNETFIPWSEVSRIKDWPVLEVLDVYGKDGTRVLSVDYKMMNFEPFYRQLMNSAGAKAVR